MAPPAPLAEQIHAPASEAVTYRDRVEHEDTSGYWLLCSSLELILSVQWLARIRAPRFITLFKPESE